MWLNGKRICAFLLALAIMCTLVPAGAFSVFAAENEETEVTEQETTGIYVQKEADAPEEPAQKVSGETPSKEDYAQIDLVFDRINDMEETPEKKGVDQGALTEAAIEIVLASDSYVEGSLERSGNAFTWWTDSGVRCLYNPRLQKISKTLTPEKGINKIENEFVPNKAAPTGKDVFLIGPYYGYDSSFSNQYRYEASEIAAAIGDTNGYTLYSGTSATVDRVAQAISNGGVVIFDSHGTTDYAYGDDYVTGATSSYLCLTTTSGLTTTDYQLGAMYSTSGESAVNGAVIANHMTKNSPGGILWMAICLGMATDGLYKSMRKKGVEVVYGYSQSVTFGGDYRFEEAFWDEMKEGYTVAESIATMKSTYGNWDYSYQIAVANGWSSYASTIASARYNYCAFPIVVSDQDTHPGQRTASQYASSGFFGADSLQTVKSTYKLFEGGSDDVNVFTWDVSDGVFTVTGNGDMPNYSSASAYPWYEYRNSIYSVVIGDGVTSVADYAFSGFPYIKQVDLGKTVKTVGIQSFYNCSSLQELYAPGTLTTIRTSGFTGCNNVQNVYFGGSSSSWSSLSNRPYPNRIHYNVSTMTGHWTQKTVQATCTTDGYTCETCGCGYVQNKVTTQTALGHSYRQTVVNPTCTAGGYTNYTCTVCGYSYTGNAVAATGHSYQKTVMAPTCTANGYTHYNCTMCGYSYTDDVVPATGHNYQPTVFAPTCTASGFTRYSCTACGHHYTDDYLPATGHSYGATVVVKPTITSGGYSYIACTQCDFVYTFNHTSPLQMSAPTISVSLSKTGKPALSWTYELEAKFEIYRATSKNGTYSKLTTTDSTTIWDTTAVVGKTYYYKIRAVYAYDSSKVSPYSNVVSAAAIAEAPSISVENNSSGKPYLSWEKVDGAKKYTIYVATSQNGSYKKLGTSTKTYYTDTKAKAGNTYYYKIIANASSSKYNSPYSNIVSCSVICGTPTVTVTVDTTTGKPSLSWKKVDGATQYAIYRKLPGGEFTWLITQTAVSYKDTTAPVDTKCEYYVQALGKTAALNGAPSKVVSATSGIPKPTVTGSLNDLGQPKLSWKQVEGAVKYEVYRSTKSGSGYVLIQTVEGLTCEDTTATIGKTYYYKVKAVGAVSKSADSSYVKLVGKCATPELFIETDDSARPYLKWYKVDGAKKYTVYRATSQNGKYSKLGTTTKIEYVDTKATPGSVYYYKIIANASSSKYSSGYSNIVSCPVYCATPTVTVTNNSAGAPVISWNKVTGAVKYKVMYMDATDYNGSSFGPYADFETYHTAVYTTKTSFTIPNTKVGRFYMVVVVAVAKNESYNSEGSEEVFADAVPAAPKLTGKVGTNKKPLLSWKAVDGAVRYEIYRSTKSSSGYAKIGETADLSFEDMTAAKGKTYYYKIVAVDCYGNTSTMSNYVKVKSK